MNNSIAVWWSNKKSKVSLDVNTFISKEDTKNYIEFGIKVINGIEDKKQFVCLYLPYKIYNREVEDKVPTLISSIDLTKVLFNEEIAIKTDTPNITIIKFKEELADIHIKNKKDFRYMSLNDNYELQDIKYADKILGTYIKIEIKNNHTSEEYNSLYYRIRINRLKNIVKDRSENYFFMEGLIKKTIYFDFNLNKQAKLPMQILDKFEQYNYSIDKVNVFLKTDMSTNIIFQSKQHKNIKILADIWKEYIKVDDKNDDIVIYQWKEQEIFAKFNYIKKGNLFIILVISIVILNLISNWLYSLVTGGICK